MKTSQIKMELDYNKRMAALLGWTELFEVRFAILGRPPGGSPSSRDQAAVPNWAGDFNHCCKLGLQYGVFPTPSQVARFLGQNQYIDNEAAYRFVMMDEVFIRLTPRKESDAEKLNGSAGETCCCGI